MPCRINPRRNTPRYIIFKLTKIKFKEKVLNTAREKQQMTYQEIPKRLSADFQQKLCRPERVAERNQKLYRQSKAKRLYHHQTSFTTNAKGTALGRNIREGKKPTKTNQNHFLNGNRHIHIDNYLDYKWIKYSNQKTQTG